MHQKPSLINRNSIPFCRSRPLATLVFAAPTPAASVTKHPNFGAKLRFPDNTCQNSRSVFLRTNSTPPQKSPMTKLPSALRILHQSPPNRLLPNTTDHSRQRLAASCLRPALLPTAHCPLLRHLLTDSLTHLLSKNPPIIPKKNPP